MQLQIETIQFLLLLLASLFVSRALLPLRCAHIPRDQDRPNRSLLLLALLIPIIAALSPSADPVNTPTTIMTLALGFIWVLSLLPTPPLAENLRRPHELSPNRSCKLLLLALFGCTLLIPQAFVPLFVLTHMLNQSKYRLVSTTELLMPHTLSVILCTALVCSLVTPIHPAVLLITLSATAGAHYAPSAIKKLRMDWDRVNRLGNLAVAARTQNNWTMLCRIPLAQTVLTRTGFITQPIVIAIEAFAIFAFVDHRLLVVLFSALIVMHAGIFLTTGICFWKWMIALGAIIAASFAATQTVPFAPDPLNTLVLFAAAVSIPFAFTTIPTLAWYDAPIARRITFTLSDDCRTARITPYDIAPLDMILSQSRHEAYFRDAPTSLDCFGACYDRTTSVLLNQLSADTQSSAAEKAARARSILTAHATTYQNRSALENECSAIITQLRSNLARRPRPTIANYHIWNALPRAPRTHLLEILDSPNPTLTVEREVFLHCTATAQQISIDCRSVKLNIRGSECRLDTPRQTPAAIA